MRVYIADLGHNLLTFSSDVYPLGAANMATYLPAFLERDVDLDIRLFREPEDLKRALDSQVPDVIGFSNYTWNEELAYHFVKYARRLAPDVFTIMGGPNWPLTSAVQEQFLREKPELDCYVDGPTYEGERALVHLMQRFIDAGRERRQALSEAMPGSTFINPTTGEYTKAQSVPRITDLDEIPSPYLAGLMDPFFETGYFPMLQISRGCPFTCSFCNSGVLSNNKVNAHSIENMKKDLLYVAQRVKPEVNLCLADDNFAMYKRDEEVADYLRYLQDKYNWPRYIRTTTGKNNGERIIRVMRKIRGVLPMTAAVQSMNPTVLKNIKRSNIKLETYAQLQEELDKQGMQSYGELILSMPGETKETFLGAIEKFLDTGAKRVAANQLMLLHGAELSNPDQRERFGLKTRWRLVARNIGNYTGEPVMEVEEMVVDTPDFPFEDYLDARSFHLLLTTFFYEGNFEEAFELAHLYGVKPYALCRALQDKLSDAPPAFKKVVDGFIEESQTELFDTRQEVIDWAHENYDDLVSGEVGGNLLSKYSMMGRFLATHGSLDYLGSVIREATNEAGKAVPEDELAAVMHYLKAVVLHVPFAETTTIPVRWESDFDVLAWVGDGYKQPLADYRHDGLVGHAHVDDERQRLIMTKIETFGEHPSGLGKITRTLFAKDLRRTLSMDQ